MKVETVVRSKRGVLGDFQLQGCCAAVCFYFLSAPVCCAVLQVVM